MPSPILTSPQYLLTLETSKEADAFFYTTCHEIIGLSFSIQELILGSIHSVLI